MDINGLITSCVKSINTSPKEITPTVVLIMPGKKRSKSGRIYLGQNRTGPVGNAIQETTEGLWVIFDAIDTLAYCMAVSDLTLDENLAIRPNKDGK